MFVDGEQDEVAKHYALQINLQVATIKTHKALRECACVATDPYFFFIATHVKIMHMKTLMM